jgi:hypothetical protein
LDQPGFSTYIYDDGYTPKPRGANDYKPIKYVLNSSGCWICVSHARQDHRGGYPVLERNGKWYRMSRYIYEIETGFIDAKKFVMHTCDNPKCINPDHLVLGTPKENTLDMINKKRKPVGEAVKGVKLTEQQVIRIFNDKRGCNTVAKEYGVSKKSVLNIRHGRTWKHLGLVQESEN